jgi:hypothetical protein
VRLVAEVRRPLVVQHHGELPPGGRALALHRLANRAAAAHLFTGAGHGQADPWRTLGVRRPLEALEAGVVAGGAGVVAGGAGVVAGGAGVGDRGRDGDELLWVGRLVPGKDPLCALDVVARLRQTRPAAHLTMVTGDPALAPAVDRRVARLGLGDAVRVVGPIPHEEMAGHYRQAGWFLSTSRHEGSGYALLEALHAGLTPIVTDLPSHRAIAAGLGRFFAPGDAESAARHAQSAPIPPPTVAAEVTARLGWDRVAADLVAAYRAVLADR